MQVRGNVTSNMNKCGQMSCVTKRQSRKRLANGRMDAHAGGQSKYAFDLLVCMHV